MIAASNSSEKLSTGTPLLTLHHVTKRYGGVTALNDAYGKQDTSARNSHLWDVTT